MKNILILIISFFLFTTLSGQNNLEKGEKAFNKLEFSKAIKYYEKGLLKSDDLKSIENLAHSYRLTKQYGKAQKWYAEAVRNPSARSINKLYYAKMLLSNEKVDQAKKWATKYLNEQPNDPRGKSLILSCNLVDNFLKNGDLYKVKKANFNSEVSDFAPTYYKNLIVFTSEKGGKINPWTGRPFATIMQSDLSSNPPKALSGNINGKYNNGAASFYGDEMYFTKNNGKKNKVRTLNLMISHASLKGEKWKLEGDFPYNSKDYNTAHPSLSKDGSFMIFSSDRPNGNGGMDLYISHLKSGKWSEPKNLGSNINTPGDEKFPFIDNQGQLIYASDGLPGMGGLDIFKAKKSGSSWISPTNLGSPINSIRDDYGLITKDKLRSGFFSSNRGNDDGIENIYSYSQNVKPLELSGIVIDELTKFPIPDAMVEVKNLTIGQVQFFNTEGDGRFNFALQPDQSYKIHGSKNNIQTNSKSIQTNSLNPNEKFYVELIHNDPRFTLNGKVINKKTGAGIPNVEVLLFNTTNMKKESIITKSDGAFIFQLEQNSDYEITGKKDNYFTTVKKASTKGLNRSTTLFVKLVLSIEEILLTEIDIVEGVELGGFEFQDILYDLDKSDIRSDAAIELDKLVQVLKNNPTIKIELNSHTDSRGKNTYNKILSLKRAKAVVRYLVKNNITENRITPKGYGEERPRKITSQMIETYPFLRGKLYLDNSTINNLPKHHQEKAHQLNRRTSFTIVGK